MIPKSEAITPEDAENYKQAASEEHRRAHVRLEKHRYANRTIITGWDADDIPPVKAFIHQLVLRPFLADLSHWRLPSLGVIYVLTEDEKPTFVEQKLPRVALTVAEEILRVRLKWLLGGNAPDTLQRLGDREQVSDSVIVLAAKFVFAHHWLYPYDPAAHKLLQTITTDCKSLCTLCGSKEPLWFGENDSTLDDLLRTVAADLVVLADAIGITPQEEAMAAACGHILTALHILTGCMHVVKGRSLAMRKPKEKEDIALVNPVLPPSDRLHIPVFKYISNTFKNYRKTENGESEGGGKKQLKAAKPKLKLKLKAAEKPEEIYWLLKPGAILPECYIGPYTPPSSLITSIEKGADPCVRTQSWTEFPDAKKRFHLLRILAFVSIVRALYSRKVP